MSTTTTLFGSTEAQAARDLIGGTAIGDIRNDLLKQILVATANRIGGSSSVGFADITGSPGDNAALAAALAAKLDLTGGTMTGALVNSVNGAASTPALHFTGTPFSGGSSTTTKPLFLLEPTGTTSNNWTPNGTMAAVNGPSGFTGMLAELQLNGARRFAIGSDGWIHGMAGNTMVIAPAAGQNLALYPTSGGGLAIYTSTTYQAGNNLVFDTATGTKIGTATGQKLGFWNATPVVQQVLATGGGATVDNVITFLQTIGLCKQS